jgi:uncharacterized protein YciI
VAGGVAYEKGPGKDAEGAAGAAPEVVSEEDAAAAAELAQAVEEVEARVAEVGRCRLTQVDPRSSPG